MADALIGAVKTNDVALVKQLIGGGVDVNGGDRDGWTALHWAANRGFVECTKLFYPLQNFWR